MNAKIKALSAFFVMAVILGSMPLLVSANGNNKWPLGVEIVGTFDEILSAHQTAIDTFITEHKVLMAETQAERLTIIEGKQDELRDKISEVNAAREEWLACLQNGTIPGEEFAAGMRALATDLNGVSEIGQELGQILGDLGKELADELKALAEGLVAVNQQLAEDMAAAAETIASEMKNRDLPVPENLPNVPEEIPPV